MAALVLLGCYVLTGWVRRYALRSSMLDLPNSRSSHQLPTPRGGGLAIAVTVLPAIASASALGWLPANQAVALAGGGVPVALVGWLDDRRGVGAITRLMVQAVAAAWSLWWLGGLPTLRVGSALLPLGIAGVALGILAIMWATNCFNFMDGIDGLAAGEAMTVGAAGTLLLMSGGGPGLAIVPLLLAAASAGFLPWNWAPARIFMGDVGSGLLGFLFGSLAVASENAGALSALGWTTLLGAFVFDATFTLLRRAWRGERWYQAHRSHAYQRAVQSGWSHSQVTATILLVNIALAALVWVARARPSLAAPMGLTAVAFLAGIYFAVQRRWAARGSVV